VWLGFLQRVYTPLAYKANAPSWRYRKLHELEITLYSLATLGDTDVLKLLEVFYYFSAAAYDGG
jgi:hypothetical protein